MWVTGMTRRDVFWRSAMSGGRSTIARRAGKGKQAAMVSGDFSATASEGYAFLLVWCVECKWRADFQWNRAAHHGTGWLLVDWEQAVDQTPPGRLPMMLLKEDRRGELCGVDSRGLEVLRAGIVRWTSVPVVARFPRVDLNLLDLRDVLVRCSWEAVRESLLPLV